MPEGADKARAHLQSEYIDENDEAEVLGIDQHVMVYFEAEAASKDAHKEHEGHAEAYALEAQLSKHEPQGTDEADERADDGQGGYTYNAADAAHVTQAFFKDIPDIANMYKDGKMWYAIPVEHLGTKKSTNPNQPLPLEGNYGIVRNNYYKITLGELLSLGHGVFDPDEPIVPGEKADKWYLGARVNVNAWNIVTQKSNLQE